jgi:cytoskeleton protein RodZ
MSREIAPLLSTDDEASVGPETEEALETAVEIQPVAEPDVGQQLRAARKARGISVSDAAKSLKLSPWQVEALEADDWSSLPCNTIIRGFVRNYARLLNLNSDSLMTALDRLQMPQPPELKMPAGTPVSLPQEGTVDRRDYARVLVGLIVLALAVVAYFFVPVELWQSTLASLKAATQSSKVVAKNVAVPAADEIKTPDAPVVPAVTSERPETTDEPVAPAQSLPAVEPTPASPPSSGNGLKFNFAQPSWVEVRDRNGQVIFSQLSQAGSQQEIEGEPPFALVIGNSTHVTLQYKGKVVDFPRRSKDDVARLTLE